jgi:ferredoxin
MEKDVPTYHEITAMSLTVLNNSQTPAAPSPNTGVPMKKIARIEVDRDLCIGAESCAVIAPEVFEMDAENKAVVKNPAGSDDQTILMAAQSCPVAAVLLYDEEGNQLYP